MNILIVSQQAYSHTNRGIDNITEILSENNNVTHLHFFSRKIYDEHIINNIQQKYFEDKIKLYRDKMKYFLPGWLLKKYFTLMISKNKSINFEEFDFAIIESGYPIYLGLELSIPIIYRQSDPTEIAFNSNRKFYKRIEHELIKKSLKCSSAFPIEYFYEDLKNKYNFWKTGFIKSANIEIYKTIPKENCIAYMGKYPIDEKFLRKLSKKFPNLKIYIIGDYKVSGANNIVCTGYLNNNAYEEIIAKSKIFIIPFEKKYIKHLRIQGITSKYYFPMELGIPIVVRKHGFVNSDKEKKIYTYENDLQAIETIKELLNESSFEDFYFVSESTKEFINQQTIEYKRKEILEFYKI